MEWGITMEVLVFLYWLASPTSYRVVSEAFDMPQSTVCDVVHRINREIRALGSRLICFPEGDELEEVGAGSAHLAVSPAFSHVVGSIDGCHVRFVSSAENKKDYFNCKLFYSIQMQVICDHRGTFFNLVAGFPGSVHDAHFVEEIRCLPLAAVPTTGLVPPGGWRILMH